MYVSQLTVVRLQYEMVPRRCNPTDRRPRPRGLFRTLAMGNLESTRLDCTFPFSWPPLQWKIQAPGGIYLDFPSLRS
jgi:hypothetical protein